MNEEQLIKNLSDYKSMNMTLNYLATIPYMDVNVEKLLTEQGLKRIAIYGMSFSGQAFFQMMKNTSIQIVYVLDQSSNVNCEGTEVRLPENATEDVDAVIIASEYYFKERKDTLDRYIDVPAILLRDILEQIIMTSGRSGENA